MSEVVELEVLEGLVPFVLDELDRLGSAVEVLDQEPTAVRVEIAEDADAALLGLRTVVAAHAVLTFDVSRPRTLRSPEHLRRIVERIAAIRRANAKGAFRGFRISAAGSDSEVFAQLAGDLAAATGLAPDPDGELLVRVRRSKVAERGWDVLLRLTPRPLSTRPWRVANYPGAVNATVAAAMVDLTSPAPTDRVLNLMCGSGTLLVERLTVGTPTELVGVDHNPDALDATRANLRAARRKGRVDLWHRDATHLSEVDQPRFDVVLADLPWGTLVGSHEGNAELYPAALVEAARVAVPGARFAVLTHEVRLMERLLRAQEAWRPISEIRVFQKGHHPRLHLLERADAR